MEKFAVEPIKNVEDINRVIDYFDSHNQQRNKLLFVLCINSGLRMSDIIALKFRDLLNEDYSIKSKANVQENKTGRTSTIYINDCIANSFKDYVKALGNSINMNDFVFNCSVPNSHIAIHSVERMFKKIINDELGIDLRFGTHSMRKTFAYQIVANAPDKNRAIDILQNRLGFKSRESVIQYACLN